MSLHKICLATLALAAACTADDPAASSAIAEPLTLTNCADHPDEVEPPGLRAAAAKRVEWRAAHRDRSRTVTL